jgi:2-dehydropantoate 2-reductase
MKLMVTGIGGVGGYVAAVLCNTFDSVTLVARKERKKSLEQKGLVVHSDYMGEHVFHPQVVEDPAAAGIQDILFVCVKNYSLKDALAAALPCIGDNTIVVPIMNGVDHGQVARSLIPRGHVVDSVIYITTAYDEDYSIRQAGRFAKISIGSPQDEQNRIVCSVLDQPGMKCRIVKDIEAEIWQKYILNCAYNVITAYYECDILDVTEDALRRNQYRTLLEEATAVGMALQVHLPEDIAERLFTRIMNQENKHVSSSLARDVMARRPNELETFSGYLVRTAHEQGLTIPLTEQFYNALKSRY